jgi:hypothetical protein
MKELGQGETRAEIKKEEQKRSEGIRIGKK